jgi:hypothetical protein
LAVKRIAKRNRSGAEASASQTPPEALPERAGEIFPPRETRHLALPSVFEQQLETIGSPAFHWRNVQQTDQPGRIFQRLSDAQRILLFGSGDKAGDRAFSIRSKAAGGRWIPSQAVTQP